MADAGAVFDQDGRLNVLHGTYFLEVPIGYQHLFDEQVQGTNVCACGKASKNVKNHIKLSKNHAELVDRQRRRVR
jgi:hypothetical protein